MFQEEIEYLEELLIAGDFTSAADGSAALLRSAAEQGGRPLSQQRLMFAVLQSHFYAQRQSELMEQLNRDFEGILGLPVQAFLLWQLLELEMGGAGSLRQCHAQTLAFLQQLAALQRKESADSTSCLDESPQWHQAYAADQDSKGSTYVDTVALFRLFISDITCQGLQDFTSATAFLDSETAVQLLQPQDLVSFRAKVTEASHARVLCPPGAADACGHSHVAQRQASPSALADSAPAESSPYCTMVGEMYGGELDVQPKSVSASAPAHSVTHPQGLQGYGTHTSGSSWSHAPVEQRSVAQSQHTQAGEGGLVHKGLRGTQLWAARFAEGTVGWGKALLAAWGRGSLRSMENVPGSATSSSNSEDAQECKAAWGSTASELALAAAVAVLAWAAYHERKAITDATRKRSRALRAALLDLGKMGFSFSSGYVPAQ